MHTVKNRLIAYTVLISMIPIIILGILYYNSLVNSTKDNINRVSIEKLNHYDDEIQGKTNKMQNVVERFFMNEKVQSKLRNVNFSVQDDESISAKNEFDSIFSELFSWDSELKDVIVFPMSGGVYDYNHSFQDENILKFSMKYGMPDTEAEEITWFGKARTDDFSSVTDKSGGVIMAGLVLRDNAYMLDNKILATVYIVLKNDFFENRSEKASEDDSIMIYDKSARVIYSKGENVFSNIWQESLDSGKHIFGAESGNFHTKINGKDYMIVFFTSYMTKWKYVNIVPYQNYFVDSDRIGFITILMLILISLFMILIYYFIVRKITRPINELATAMKEVKNQNFDISVDVKHKDEFGLIGEGFNAMVERIKVLFDQAVLEERKRKDAVILALQYQINPHFLYNTLSAIRFKAIEKEDRNVAEMLLVLGRFLQKTIKNANKMIRIEDEIKNIDDYIKLCQIRFNNQLQVKYEIDVSVINCKIPGMLIQPNVENAVKHGLHEKIGRGETAEILISAKEKDDAVCISIRDNGIGMSKEKIDNILCGEQKEDDGLHIGINNIHERIRLLYGDEYGVTISSKEGVYTDVKITLPKIQFENTI